MAFLLETDRLLIRPYKDSDLESLFAYLDDPQAECDRRLADNGEKT